MTPFFRTVVDRDELSSTSDLARELVEAGSAKLPLLVRARRQTAGRGRGLHRWWSDPGSLTFTLAIDPSAHALRREHEPRVALAIAVGLIETIEAQGVPVSPRMEIRWPNDVEVSGRKIAGILPERIETDRGPRLLIGIGLNVSTDLTHAPAEVRAMAMSLDAWAGSRDADTLLSAFLSRFPTLLARLAQDDPEIASFWAERDSLLGQPVRLAVGPSVMTGLGGGIDPAGGLIVVGERGAATYFGGQVLR